MHYNFLDNLPENKIIKVLHKQSQIMVQSIQNIDTKHSK